VRDGCSSACYAGIGIRRIMPNPGLCRASPRSCVEVPESAWHVGIISPSFTEVLPGCPSGLPCICQPKSDAGAHSWFWPTPPICAAQQVGSYLGYTGRDDHGGATAAHDSQPTFCVSTRTCFNYKLFACHRPICSKEPTSLLAVSTHAVHVTRTVRSRQARHKLANLRHRPHKRSHCHRFGCNWVSRPPRRSSSPRSRVFRSDCIKASGPGS